MIENIEVSNEKIDKSAEVHSLAFVHPKAHLSHGVVVGAGTIIGPEVQIGANTIVGPNVVLDGKLRIGSSN